MTKDKDIMEINGEVFKKEAFVIEEDHPAIGRILIVDGIKFRILDDAPEMPHRSGTFIRRMTEKDEEAIKEYDEALEELSNKLVKKIDIKRMIKENIKSRPLQDLKTGLYILKSQDDGEDIEEEHIKGCYNYRIHKGKQSFDFITGDEIRNF